MGEGIIGTTVSISGVEPFIMVIFSFISVIQICKLWVLLDKIFKVLNIKDSNHQVLKKLGLEILSLCQKLNFFPNISVNLEGEKIVEHILEIPRLLIFDVECFNCDTTSLCYLNNSLTSRHLIPMFIGTPCIYAS